MSEHCKDVLTVGARGHETSTARSSTQRDILSPSRTQHLCSLPDILYITSATFGYFNINRNMVLSNLYVSCFIMFIEDIMKLAPF